MHIPLYSTITLVAELFISTAIYYTIYQGYKHNKFPTKLAAFALLYEIVFNISYMASRTSSHLQKNEIPWHIALAAFHGILSIIMFLSLIVFFIFAWKSYKKEHNFFKHHKYVTIVFLVFWTISIVSGVFFYFVEYFL